MNIKPYWFDPAYAGPADWWKAPEFNITLARTVDIDTDKTTAIEVGVKRGKEKVGIIAQVAITADRPEAEAPWRGRLPPDMLDDLSIPGVEDCRELGPFVPVVFKQRGAQPA